MTFLVFIIFIFICIIIAGACLIGVLVYRSHTEANGVSEENDPYYAKELRLIKILSTWEAIFIGCTMMLIRWVL